MNNATLENTIAASDPINDDHHANDEFAYRAVSKSAVACFVFAALSIVATWMNPVFVILPVLGTTFGIVALLNFKRFPDELIGKQIARIGLGASLVCMIAGSSFHSYIYATEVPEGYVRMGYSDLRPNPRTSLPFSEKAIKLDGKKVFLKGYVRPSLKKKKLKDFILVGDYASCCFGGNPDITDIVAIKIIGDETVDYSRSLRRVVGTFKLNQNARRINEKDIPEVFYEIHADSIR